MKKILEETWSAIFAIALIMGVLATCVWTTTVANHLQWIVFLLLCSMAIIAFAIYKRRSE